MKKVIQIKKERERVEYNNIQVDIDESKSKSNMSDPSKPSITIDQQLFYSSVKYVRSNCMSFLLHLQRRISIETIRPINEFLGINNEQLSPGGSGGVLCGGFGKDVFSSPVSKLDKSTCERLMSRIATNSTYFISNYAMILLGVAVIIALLEPKMIMSLCVLWGLWTFHTFLKHNACILMGYNLASLFTISQRHRCLTCLTIVTLLFKCFNYAVTVLGITTVIVVTHVLLRNTNHILEQQPQQQQQTKQQQLDDPHSNNNDPNNNHPSSDEDGGFV